MHPIFLIALYLGVVLAPLALAFISGLPPRSLWDELATGAGLLAFAVILVEFVLSGRFRSVSRGIGMDVTMRFHRLLAQTALVLALIHPFLYRAPFNPPLPFDPSRQLTLTASLEHLFTGILAWVLLPAFVVLAIGRDRLGYRYETWRLLHGLGAVLIAALLLHHTLEAGRYSAAPQLAILWIVLFGLAIFSLAYVYVGQPLRQSLRPWRVHSVRPLGLKTWRLVLKPQNHAGLRYEAGQFAWIKIGARPFTLTEHPFSIASAPAGGPDLEFIIKELGDFTSTVGSIEPGTPAFVDGPHGNLVVSDHRPHGVESVEGVALIAGGVGIAPLIAVLRQLHLEGDKRPTMLVYGNRIADQIVAEEELRRLAHDHGTEIVHVLSQPPADWTGETGMLDAVMLRRLFRPEMKDWLFVLCGPDVMMSAAEDTLIGLGVPPGQILSERFQYD